jgi:hypothetical protein
MDESPSPVPLDSSLLADYIQHNAYDENDDEYITDYIDLTLFAIVQNMERLDEFRVNPTSTLMQDITEHSITITLAENCLNVHIQRIIRNFCQNSSSTLL